jgi:hypothetical protein
VELFLKEASLQFLIFLYQLRGLKVVFQGALTFNSDIRLGQEYSRWKDDS